MFPVEICAKAGGTQHSAMTVQENRKSVLDKEEYVCYLFMDLSKAFDTIDDGLLMANWKVYGFSDKSLDLMCFYLKNSK